MASDHALAFLIDGPMQSWGVASRFQRRDSESFPSKSGVLGLLCAALGIDKFSEAEVGEITSLSELKFSVFRVAPEDTQKKVIRLEDFHTVGGGFDRTHPKERLHISQKASGGPSTTIITHRTYLTDARFVVVLEGNLALLERCHSALEDPKWGIWFGRKSCLPASPLSPVLGESLIAALQAHFKRLSKEVPWRILEGREESNAEGSWFQSDEPVSFGSRTFKSRPLRRTDPCDSSLADLCQ